MKKIITNIIVFIFASLTVLYFVSHFSVAQGSLITKNITKGQMTQVVELKGQNKKERKANLEKLIVMSKTESDVVLLYQDYKKDTLVDYYASNVSQESNVLKINEMSKSYKIKPLGDLLSQEEKIVLTLEIAGSSDEFILKAQQDGIISKDNRKNEQGNFESINYQSITLFYSIIVISSIIALIYRTKENKLRKINGFSLLNRILNGYLLHFMQQLIIIATVSLGYYLLLKICMMESLFFVYQEFILYMVGVLAVLEGVTFMAIELFSIRDALKNKMPKTFLLIGIILYKFFISLITISVVTLFSYNMQVAINDVKAYAVYDKMSEYKAISYVSDSSTIAQEDIYNNKFSKQVYPILDEAKVMYFDSDKVSNILETIRNGNLSKASLQDAVENKTFPVNNEYIQQFVQSSQKETFLTKQKEADIVVIASSFDRDKMKDYEKDKRNVCDLLNSSDRELCQNYNVKFVYYDNIDLVIPNPFFQNAPEFITKRPVLVNFNLQVAQAADVVKLNTTDGFLSSMFVKEKDISSEKQQRIAQILNIDKLSLVNTATGYEDVIAQGKAKLQRASTDLILFLSASVILSIFMIMMFIEEYKKKLALERFAGKSWFSKYSRLFGFIIWSWIIGFLVKEYLPFDTVLFNRHFHEYNGIFYITISVIIIIELLVLLLLTRQQEKKAITKILKNE